MLDENEDEAAGTPPTSTRDTSPLESESSEGPPVGISHNGTTETHSGPLESLPGKEVSSESPVGCLKRDLGKAVSEAAHLTHALVGWRQRMTKASCKEQGLQAPPESASRMSSSTTASHSFTTIGETASKTLPRLLVCPEDPVQQIHQGLHPRPPHQTLEKCPAIFTFNKQPERGFCTPKCEIC